MIHILLSLALQQCFESWPLSSSAHSWSERPYAEMQQSFTECFSTYSLGSIDRCRKSEGLTDLSQARSITQPKFEGRHRPAPSTCTNILGQNPSCGQYDNLKISQIAPQPSRAAKGMGMEILTAAEYKALHMKSFRGSTPFTLSSWPRSGLVEYHRNERACATSNPCRVGGTVPHRCHASNTTKVHELALPGGRERPQGNVCETWLQSPGVPAAVGIHLAVRDQHSRHASENAWTKCCLPDRRLARHVECCMYSRRYLRYIYMPLRKLPGPCEWRML